MHKTKIFSISSSKDIEVKLTHLKSSLKSSDSYKGRISDSLIINSLINIIYERLDFIKSVSGNDEVEQELRRVLITNFN